jgi:hypothetical protein
MPTTSVLADSPSPMTPPQSNVKFVNMFGRKISRAAFYTLFAGVVFAIVISVFIPYGIFIGVYILLVFLLLSYNVNCAQVGHCYVWAWILTFIYVTYVSLSVLIIITNKDVWMNLYIPQTKQVLSKIKAKK